jgi:hypothetical protein
VTHNHSACEQTIRDYRDLYSTKCETAHRLRDQLQQAMGKLAELDARAAADLWNEWESRR